MSHKTDYAEIIRLSKENPTSRKRLLVIDPEVKLTKDDILDIMTNDSEIKHFLVQDKTTEIGSVKNPNTISLDFSEYKGPGKKAYLMAVVRKQLANGGTALVWNYAPESFAYRGPLIYHVAKVPDTKGKFGLVGEGSGAWPAYFEGIKTLPKQHDTLKSFFEDKDVKGTTFAVARCEGCVDVAKNEVLMNDSLHRLIDMEAGEIYYSDVDDDGEVKSKYVMFLKDGVNFEHLKNTVDFILSRKLGQKTERTIVLIGSIELSNLDIYKLVPDADNSFELDLYADIIDKRVRDTNRAQMLRKSNPSAPPKPTHVVRDAISNVNFDYLHLTNAIKYGVNVVLVSLTKRLYIDCYHMLLEYGRLSKSQQNIFFIPTDKGSVNYIETISRAVNHHMDCIDWKEPVENKTFYFFHYEGEKIDIDALISKLGESEYYVKYLSTVWSYDSHKRPKSETSFRLREETYPKSSEKVGGYYQLILNTQVKETSKSQSDKGIDYIEWVTHKFDSNKFWALKDGLCLAPVFGGWGFYDEDKYFSIMVTGGEKDIDIECRMVARIVDGDFKFPGIFVIPTNYDKDLCWLIVSIENINSSELLVLEITTAAGQKLVS